ncbi:hypothetical protein I3760_10G090200 [Carya illinoinensis]|uniref:VQ domain-containing protein n=1 Tax=Carya illinoinensis TaxID=32201 RepID=A0A8T1PC83_CARIL|nr:VQ motif-containing protein 10-like [Carya illinoinensis]KAG2684768.1 hypothetical protein I3760_10G090200 [Carya illinoinensis]KAG6639324.1 hypothetical protein CIPAW_10G091400 [Carya illinoinensis]
MACSVSGKAVKVVHIDTQYVETDPLNFKSVVQSLTGKDSCVAWIEKSSFGANKRKRSPVTVNNGGGSFDIRPSCGRHDNGSTVGSGNLHVSVLSKGMSFKDLDGMILEDPPMEELMQWLMWTE